MPQIPKKAWMARLCQEPMLLLMTPPDCCAVVNAVGRSVNVTRHPVPSSHSGHDATGLQGGQVRCQYQYVDTQLYT